jgi:hypothetical protein
MVRCGSHRDFTFASRSRHGQQASMPSPEESIGTDLSPEDVMTLHSPTHSPTPAVLAFTRYFARPHCPRCGEMQVAPDQSEFVCEGVIHHIWACDGCGHEFATTVDLEINRDAA